ncbi:P-loop containing nucleoside triphosphate hydrolase protein [Mycena floridula]|nr:P-loop containing nucleoside triphosphate hydrolase protein [Mycena floridula]
MDAKPFPDSIFLPHQDDIKPRLYSEQFGVYTVVTAKKRPFEVQSLLRRIETCICALNRLFWDVYGLGPHLVVFYVLLNIWDTIEDVAMLESESRILRIIELDLSAGRVNARAIVLAAIIRIVFLIISAMVKSWKATTEVVLDTRTQLHFNEIILRSRLKKDMKSVHSGEMDDESESLGRNSSATRAFRASVATACRLGGALTQLGFVYRLAGTHGSVFSLLCLARPVIEAISYRPMWFIPRIVVSTQPAFVRLRSLMEMSTKAFKLDVLSCNIEQWLIQEFRQCRMHIGDRALEMPEIQQEYHRFFITDIVTNIFGDFPMMYYVGAVLLNPKNMSITTIAILQHCSALLRQTFRTFFDRLESLDLMTTNMQATLYPSSGYKVDTSNLPYPGLKPSEDSPGMSFELRNVSFSYPGSSAKALDNISLSIKPGQLVVIVGANGSGKSTIVKLLARLYDSSDGQVLVDGVDIRNYSIGDLRQATANLTQDHQLYPLTLGENIGLGDPEHSEDRCRIVQAAKQGGASGILERQMNGLDTILHQPSVQYMSQCRGNPDAISLLEYWREMKQRSELSGGERQRVVAARTFMRLQSGKIKFVAVDEPTSALDAEGERDLFNNLREVRKGKTMVFVTHRFGHLTTCADMIICMKAGQIAESGTHLELMAKAGEYFKFYALQAQAFV